MRRAIMTAAVIVGSLVAEASAQETVFSGRVTDATTGEAIPARIYIESTKSGLWYFAESADPAGRAVRYRKQRGRSSSENHVTLSAHPFQVELEHGEYLVTVERGKEYRPWQATVVVKGKPIRREIKLHRWIDMAKRGWYSGDTHVHRTLSELPLVVKTEQVNVAFPLTDWITVARRPPDEATAPGKLIRVDKTHVIYPRNTEYEIFSINRKPHVLGAVLLLGHKTRFKKGVPPVGPIAEQTHREGGLIDLEKHSWPWSMVLVPTMKVDLYQLLNNHAWRTNFAMRNWYTGFGPEYMKLQKNDRGWTEWGWVDFGLQNYYALLNCGFPLMPSAGTASGVHPVPLGFSRVYVHLPKGFSYDQWMKGLAAGRTFVTNGPMLFVEFNGKPPGSRVNVTGKQKTSCHIVGTAEGAQPIDRIEIIVNGRVVKKILPGVEKTKQGGYVATLDETINIAGSSWIAVRCHEKHVEQRVRIAHTAPVFFDDKNRPLRPRREEIDYLISRVEQELLRNKLVLTKPELAEIEQALDVYKKIRAKAKTK